jgi:hypothetical protein
VIWTLPPSTGSFKNLSGHRQETPWTSSPSSGGRTSRNSQRFPLVPLSKSSGRRKRTLCCLTTLPPYEWVFLGSEEARFSDILTLSEAERPIMLVGVMRDYTPGLVPLCGPARYLDPPYARTTAHAAPVVFCRDVVHGNLPASALFDCNWLVTESLGLIKEDAFVARLDDCAPGADVVNELAADTRDEHYTARAAIMPGG